MKKATSEARKSDSGIEHHTPQLPFHSVQTSKMCGKAIFLSLSRQLLFLLPGLLFLPDILAGMGYNGSWGVWCSMPLSDLLASLVAALMLLRELRRFRKRMQI